MVAPAMALLGAPSPRPGSLASIRVSALLAFGAPAVAAPARACFSRPNRSLVSTAATPANDRFESSQLTNAIQQIDKPSRPQQYKDVVLSSLPPTATPSDIRSLALGKTRNDLARIEFLYTKSMRPSGRAIASFSNAGHARTFEETVQGRILGGRQVQARLQSAERRDAFLQSHYASWPWHYQLPLDLIEYERGTLVLLRNIPQDTFEARLEERLASRYDLRQQDRWRESPSTAITLGTPTKPPCRPFPASIRHVRDDEKHGATQSCLARCSRSLASSIGASRRTDGPVAGAPACAGHDADHVRTPPSLGHAPSSLVRSRLFSERAAAAAAVRAASISLAKPLYMQSGSTGDSHPQRGEIPSSVGQHRRLAAPIGGVDRDQLAGAAGLACDPDLLRRDPGDRLAARRVRAVCAFGDNSPFRGFLKLLIQLRVAPGRIDGDETFGKSVLCAEQPPTDLRYLLHIERNDTGVTCGDRRMTTWRKEITTEMNDPWERATATFLSCRAPCGCSGLFWLGPHHPNARSLGEPRVCWRSIRRLDWLFDNTSLRLVCTSTSVRAIAANRPEDLPNQRRRDVLPMKLVMKVPTLCGFRSAATMECTTARRVPMLGFKACMRPACDCGRADRLSAVWAAAARDAFTLLSRFDDHNHHLSTASLCKHCSRHRGSRKHAVSRLASCAGWGQSGVGTWTASANACAPVSEQGRHPAVALSGPVGETTLRAWATCEAVHTLAKGTRNAAGPLRTGNDRPQNRDLRRWRPGSGLVCRTAVCSVLMARMTPRFLTDELLADSCLLPLFSSKAALVQHLYFYTSALRFIHCIL
ncbi:hypothetical protein L1887_43642 [Cichorium endivia]|nr:hypothetical protein L1887_43642 [Cichorium endivia]